MAYDFTTLHPAYGTDQPMWKHLKEQGFDDPEVIDLGVAEMKFPLCPAIREATMAQAAEGTFGYSMASGDTLEAVCGWMARRHSWQIQPDWIIQTFGIVTAVGIAIRAYTQPGDGILVLFPSYGPFQRNVLANDRTLVQSELVVEDGEYRVDWADFEAKIADPAVKAYILCNPHNPTGRVWTRAELERMGDLCVKHDVLIISDDIHFDLVFKPYVHTVLAAMKPEYARRTVTLTAPSKTFNIAGMTISNVIISDPDLREKFEKIASLEMGHYFNAFGLAACQAGYTGGEAWLEECLTVLKANADYVRGFLARHLPMLTMLEQQGTYLCWMDCRGLNMEEKELDAFLRSAGFLSEGGAFFGEAYGRFHRVNVACPRQYLESALLRLEAACRAKGLVK